MLFFQKQIMMRRVLISLIPVYLFALYLYGLSLAILTMVVVPLAVAAEFIFKRIVTPKEKKVQVTEAVLVTALLFVLSLSPQAPWWVAAIGILFAVIIVKEAFGGFGRNIFNPAISGRLFIYITFSGFMTNNFITAGNFGIDATTAATPLDAASQGLLPDTLQLLSGIRAGSFGESAVIPIIVAAVFLIITKTASYRIIISTIAGAAAVTAAFYFAGISGALPPQSALLSGSILFVAVFFATDPVSAPKKPLAQWVYGIIVGTTAILIRQFSGPFIEGTSFGVLIGNTFASLFDEVLKKREK
ncbi:MAG: RnfABCDGE type electron transport complex subunit D [Spirochaetales bacterium]|nr:RnfABCDGE type electron transport complex subunit D [Spirochaetales bacterium]